MKIIWRQYEIMLVSIITAINIIGISLGFGGITREEGQRAFDIHYANTHATFSVLRNVILPQAGAFLVFYMCYVFINIIAIVAVKKITASQNVAAVVRAVVLTACAIVATTLVLALGVNVATFYGHPSFYNYGGFGMLAVFGYNDAPMSQPFSGFGIGLVFAAVYAVYAFVREGITVYLENPANGKSYRVLVANRVVAFLVIYISLPVLVLTFHIVPGDVFESPASVFYLGFALPASLVSMLNMYWLFPLKLKKSFFNIGFIARLLFTTFLCTFPVVFFFVFRDKAAVFLQSWAFQLFVMTPVSWLAWRLQKDKILKLIGIEKELQASKASLQFLRSQINPHFLFNALNTLYGMALQEGSDNTAKGIQMLGDMMRFMLHENNLDFIAMNKEIEYLQNYVALQKLRTQSSPDIVIVDNLGTQQCNHNIAPMLLVPLVENAFKHGISLTEKSWIKIYLECDEKQIRFSVLNSIHHATGSDPEKHSTGIGLKNVRERLLLLYPNKHHLDIKKEGMEFVVQMIISQY